MRGSWTRTILLASLVLVHASSNDHHDEHHDDDPSNVTHHGEYGNDTHHDHHDHHEHADLTSYNWGDESVNTAIVWSFIAGLSTCLGGALPFFPHLLQQISLEKFIGVSFAISAGVMLYITLTEVFQKGKSGIAQIEGLDAAGKEALLVGLFAVGALFVALLGVLVEKMAACAGKRHEDVCAAHGLTCPLPAPSGGPCHDGTLQVDGDSEDTMPKRMCEKDAVSKEAKRDYTDGEATKATSSTLSGATDHGHEHHSHAGHASHTHVAITIAGGAHQPAEAKTLHRAGVLMALAIGLHNFPEGLSTFLLTVQEPSTGVALAIGVVLHNIPEGVAVAMPIYHATRSPWRAMFWCSLSGLAEPIGGLLGFAALRESFTPQVNGVVYAIVSGMMCFVVIYELLPAALRLLTRELATFCIFCGMVVMGLSFVVLAASGASHDH